MFGFKHDELLRFSIKRFWFYHRCADRLQAADDMRMAHLMAGVTSQEGFDRLQKNLSETVGEIYVYQPAEASMDADADPELDRSKLEALRTSIIRHGR